MTLRKKWGEIFPALVLLTDCLTAWLSAGLTQWLWFDLLPFAKSGRGSVPELKLWVLLAYVFWLALIGSYRRVGKQPRPEQVLDLLKSSLYSLIALVTIVFLLKGYYYSRGYIVMYFVITPVFLTISRLLLFKLNLSRMQKGWGVKNAVIVGNGRSAKAILDHLITNHALGYRIMGFLVETSRDLNFSYCGVKALGLYTECQRTIPQQQVEEVFIPDLSRHLADYSHILEYCHSQKIEVRIVSHRTDLLARVAGIYDMAGISLFRPHYPLFQKSYRAFKRTIDVLGSGLGLLFLSPVFGLSAIMIKLDSPGPVFFRQIRLGEAGREFKLFKFRTMFQGSEKNKHRLMEQNEADGPIFKIRNDPRITPVGRWLRRLSMDELPQLINVFLGEMSLVGPRPPLPFEVAQYKEWHKRRLEGPQGMTGLWQISGRSELSFEEMVLLDIYYLEHSSPVLDTEILFKTIPAVILGGGAY
ncbi:MAG: sugar transferase [bacterium]|nr:sugar transferase [bacterium]